MIHRTEATWQTSGSLSENDAPAAASVPGQSPDWQQQMATAFKRLEDLFDYIEIDPGQLSSAEAAARNFPLRVPRGYAARMEKGNLKDPLLRQVLPVADEMVRHSDYLAAPVSDRESSVAAGTLHKYQGRVLLIATGSCGVHCRYCFRRHYPYRDASAGRDNWRGAIDHLQKSRDVSEVILSGGDPLTLSDERLRRLARALEKIPHLRRLRIHTRLPLLVPGRITDELVDWFARGRLQPVMVLHANHAREISGELRTGLEALRRQGVTLLNQSVLLRGVNDSETALSDLSQSLFSSGVLPYYLHLLDRVQGAAHFEVAEPEALSLYRQIRDQLPGYLVPRLVRDESGKGSKTLLI